MSSEQLADGVNPLDAELAATWDILKGYSGRDTDLGIARRFGDAAAAYSLRDIGAMNGRVVKVRREQDDGVDDFSALQVASGSIEQFAIGTDVLALYNKASYNPSAGSDNFWRATTELDLGSGAMSFSCDFVLTGDFGSNTARLLQKYNGTTYFYWESATSLRYKIDGTAGTTALSSSVAIEKNKKYNMEFIRDASDNTTLKIDGVTVGTNTTTARNTGQILIGRISGFRLVGTALNWNFNNGQHIYAGDGVETSNWVDTGTGGNNLSKEGSPVLFTGQGISAFVDTWFDQSGNGNNATQSTTSQQPKIIDDGSIVKNVKGFPSIKFESANSTELDIGLLISNLNSVSAYIVTQKDSGDTNRVAGFTQGVSTDNSRFYFPFYTAGTTPNLGYNDSASKISFGTTLTGTCNLYSAFSGDTNIEAFKNGSSVGTTALVDQAVTATDSKIGQLSNSFRFDGVMSEIFITTKKLQDDAAVINNDVINYYNL